MTVTIEDACFLPGAKIRVEAGASALAFRRCSFEGCDIFVADAVDATVFMQCIFRGTTFSGQPLSPRIASACQCGCAEVEMATPAPVTAPHMRFRR
jgi:hypothetical protein